MMPKETDNGIEEVRNKVDQSVENIQPDSDSDTEEQKYEKQEDKETRYYPKTLTELISMLFFDRRVKQMAGYVRWPLFIVFLLITIPWLSSFASSRVIEVWNNLNTLQDLYNGKM